MANFDKVILNGTTYTIPSGGGSSYTAGDGIDITNDVISVDIDDEKKTIASALTELHNDKADKNQLNNYQLKGDYQTGAQVDAKIATATSGFRSEAEAINVEKVDAAALTDLNARVSDLEQGGGGSGITGITMNGSPVTVTSGVANLGTVVTDKSDKQDVIDSSHKLSADLVDDTNTTNKFVTASDKSTWSGKQDALVSGTNIKTINNESILGSGNIDIQGGSDINVVQTTGTSTTDVMSQNAVTNAFNGTTYGSPSTLNNSFVGSRTAYAIIYDVPNGATVWYFRCVESSAPSFTTIGIKNDDNFYDSNGQIMTDIPNWIDQELSYYDSTTRKRYVFLKNGIYADYFSNVNGYTFTIFETYNTGLIGSLLSKHSIDTDAHTTSAEKSVWNAKLDSSVITTSITSSSTDSQIPSAKAVYDALQEGGGSSYTAGEGIDITSDVITNTREQRVLRYDDTITGVKAALQVVSPHWDYTDETVSDPANNLTFVNNVPAANADPYVQRDYIEPIYMEFEITSYSVDSSSSFEFYLSEVSGGEFLVYYNGEWEDEVAHGAIISPDNFPVGVKIRVNNTMFSAFVSAMQTDCPYKTMEVQYKTYAWSSDKSVNAIHSGTSYPLAYNSDLTALAARVTALETALGNINTLLAAI